MSEGGGKIELQLINVSDDEYMRATSSRRVQFRPTCSLERVTYDSPCPRVATQTQVETSSSNLLGQRVFRTRFATSPSLTRPNYDRSPISRSNNTVQCKSILKWTTPYHQKLYNSTEENVGPSASNQFNDATTTKTAVPATSDTTNVFNVYAVSQRDGDATTQLVSSPSATINRNANSLRILGMPTLLDDARNITPTDSTITSSNSKASPSVVLPKLPAMPRFPKPRKTYNNSKVFRQLSDICNVVNSSDRAFSSECYGSPQSSNIILSVIPSLLRQSSPNGRRRTSVPDYRGTNVHRCITRQQLIHTSISCRSKELSREFRQHGVLPVPLLIAAQTLSGKRMEDVMPIQFYNPLECDGCSGSPRQFDKCTISSTPVPHTYHQNEIGMGLANLFNSCGSSSSGITTSDNYDNGVNCDDLLIRDIHSKLFTDATSPRQILSPRGSNDTGMSEYERYRRTSILSSFKDGTPHSNTTRNLHPKVSDSQLQTFLGLKFVDSKLTIFILWQCIGFSLGSFSCSVAAVYIACNSSLSSIWHYCIPPILLLVTLSGGSSLYMLSTHLLVASCIATAILNALSIYEISNSFAKENKIQQHERILLTSSPILEERKTSWLSSINASIPVNRRKENVTYGCWRRMVYGIKQSKLLANVTFQECLKKRKLREQRFSSIAKTVLPFWRYDPSLPEHANRNLEGGDESAVCSITRFELCRRSFIFHFTLIVTTCCLVSLFALLVWFLFRRFTNDHRAIAIWYADEIAETEVFRNPSLPCDRVDPITLAPVLPSVRLDSAHETDQEACVLSAEVLSTLEASILKESASSRSNFVAEWIMEHKDESFR